VIRCNVRPLLDRDWSEYFGGMKLKAQGILTEEEFAAEKAKLLG
jgi:hypothetical protein